MWIVINNKNEKGINAMKAKMMGLLALGLVPNAASAASRARRRLMMCRVAIFALTTLSFGLVTVLAPASARAALLESYASVYLNAGPSFEQYQSSTTTGVSVNETRSTAAAGDVAAANAAASATWGVLKVGGSAYDFSNGGQSYTGSGASAKWTDGVVLHSAGLGFGTLVTVKTGVSIRGELTASKAISLDNPVNSALSAAGSSSFFDFRSYGGCAYCGVFFQQQQRKDVPPWPYGPTESGDMFHDFDVSIVMMVDDWLGLQALLTGGAGATGVFGGTAEASYALDRSVYWTGITAVLGPDGQPLTDWWLSSDSGFDWRNDMRPVVDAPEPGTFALLGLGLAGLGVSRRRRAN